MRLRTQRKVIYGAMGLTLLALIGGYAAASGFGLGGGATSEQQGAQTTTISGVTGLSWVSTSLTMASSSFTNNTCSSGTPCNVTGTPATSCAGGLTGATSCAGDWVEEVKLTTVANTPFASTVVITVYVDTPTGDFAGISFYYTQTSSVNAAITITQDFGIGTATSGPGSVTAVSVVATAA